MVTPFSQRDGGVPVEPSPAPQVALDGHMRVLDFNPAAEELLGYSRHDVVGRPLSSLLPEGLGVISLSRLQEAVANGEEGDIETRKALNMRHGKGYELPVEANLTLTRDTQKGYAVIATLHSLNPEQEAQLRQSLVNRVNARLQTGGPWEELAAALHGELDQVIQFDWLSLFLIKPRCGLTRVLSWSGNEGIGFLESGQTVQLSEWMKDQTALGEPRTCRIRPQSDDNLERQLHDDGLKEMLFVPLRNEKCTLGILALAATKKGSLTLDHQELVQNLVPELVEALQRELAKSQAQVYQRRYNQLLERMEDAVFSMDLEGQMEYANPALIKLLACNDLAELKLVTPDLFQPHPGERGKLIEQLRSQGWLHNRRLEMVDCSGNPLSLTLSAHLVYDDEGHPMAIEGSLHDHTLRPKVRQSSAQEDPGQVPTHTETRDPVLMADESGMIFEANALAASLLNTTPDTLVGRPIAEVVEELRSFQTISHEPSHASSQPPTPETTQESIQKVGARTPVANAVFSSDRQSNGKQRARGEKVTLNLTQRPPDLSANPLSPPDPQTPAPPPEPSHHHFPSLVDRMRGYAHKLAQDIELDHKLEQKEELEELKVQLASLSTDLDLLLHQDNQQRTPPADQAQEIAALTQQVDWLLERMTPFNELKETAADLRQLKVQLDQRLEQLAGAVGTDELPSEAPLSQEEPTNPSGLASALSEAVSGNTPSQMPAPDTTPLVLAPLDLNHLLESTLAHLNEPLRAKATILFKAGEVPPILAQSDQIEQVLNNLLINAAEAIPSIGTISVTSREHEGFVIVDISDDGIGLTQEELNHIFEPFYSTKEGGQGLGLPLAQRIITSHQGQIKVTSKKDTGSTFSLWIPTLKGDDCPPEGVDLDLDVE